MSQTIDYYNKNANDYASSTMHADMNETQNRFLSYLNPGAHILDIGCGSGRDSKCFIDRGFKVTAMDGSSSLCSIAKSIIGQEVICKTFDQIDYLNEFDAAWACASLLHVKKDEMISVLKKVSDSLKPNGVFYVSYKYGTEQRESGERVFSDYTENDIPNLFSGETKLICQDWWISTDVRPDRKNEKWLNIISKKSQ